MTFLKTFLSFFLFSIIILPTSNATENHEKDSPRYLSRYFKSEDKKDIESCQYFPRDSCISFEGDFVYSPEYDSLNHEISKRIKFFKDLTKTENSGKVNYLTAILAATGSKVGEIERIYNNIYVTGQSKEPILSTSKSSKESKILVFCSEEFPDFSKYTQSENSFLIFKDFKSSKKDPDPYNFSHVYEDEKYESIHKLCRSSSFSKKSKIKKEFINKYDGKSHTEPLCLSAIQTLPADTFEKFLPSGYKLNYYEIHLISLFDACQDCTKIVYQQINKLKEKFGNNLFMFFHSAKPFINEYPLYKIIYKQSIIEASFNFKDSNLKIKKQDEHKELNNKNINVRENCDLKIPLYYIGIIHELEGKEVTITT